MFFFRWNISVIFCWDILVTETYRSCLTVVLKLAVQCLLAYIFINSDRIDLIFIGHFKQNSVYDQKLIEKKQIQPKNAWTRYFKMAFLPPSYITHLYTN